MERQMAKEGIISFDGYRLFRIDYKCEPYYNQGTVSDGKYTYNFAYGTIDLPDNVIQINLLVTAYFSSDEIGEDDAPLSITIEIGGKFKATDGSEWNHSWDANAIAILYPYVRGIISSVTSQAGIETITLPTINVAAMLLNSKEKE